MTRRCTCPHSGVKSSPKLIGLIKPNRKKIKLLYCQNYQTDSNQMLRNDKDRQLGLHVVDVPQQEYNKSKMADGPF